ncbi:YqhV family protein [Lederbergia sp. NSJ-179]|uniref:YqhV family protein n=1 Tax=Lederbergia sp. NSJ-179 TaxID=2931402 RepID=UPI001FD08403|nr:YqhV family protein [Lederbergia sp. NSJ-179]MCJ7839831.1 YqhV family protein [Lederbergia sp. NSJ-179]
MFVFLEKTIIAMALLRVLSGSIDILAAYFMVRFNNIEKALILNSSLALVGPIVFILASTIGLVGIADKISLAKFVWIFIGFGCILYGIKS